MSVLLVFRRFFGVSVCFWMSLGFSCWPLNFTVLVLIAGVVLLFDKVVSKASVAAVFVVQTSQSLKKSEIMKRQKLLKYLNKRKKTVERSDISLFFGCFLGGTLSLFWGRRTFKISPPMTPRPYSCLAQRLLSRQEPQLERLEKLKVQKLYIICFVCCFCWIFFGKRGKT